MPAHAERPGIQGAMQNLPPANFGVEGAAHLSCGAELRQSVRSSILAPAAALCTALMPFFAAALVF